MFPWKSSFLIVFSALSLGSVSAQASMIIQVLGKDVPNMVGVETEKLRLYSANASGTLQAIPFQIDEKSGESKGQERGWALDSEDPKDKKIGDGKFDADEVVLFLSEDAGGAVPVSQFKNSQKLVELSVGDAKKVYLSYETTPAPLNPKSYIQYDVGQDRVTTYAYELGFMAQKPLVQDYLLIKGAQQPQNILDRFKARFKLAVKGFVTFKFDEEEISSKRLGYHWGPIRVIRSVQASKSLGPIKVIPKSRTDFFFYPDWVEVPTKINNPVDGPNFLSDKTEGVSGFDFNGLITGAKLYTNAEAAPFQFQGSGAENSKTVPGKDLQWWSLLTTQSGSMIVAIQNDAQLTRLGIHNDLILNDRSQIANPPEAQAGEMFVGFELPYHRIPKGNYAVKVRQVFPATLTHGQEAFFLGNARLVAPQGAKDLIQAPASGVGWVPVDSLDDSDDEPS